MTLPSSVAIFVVSLAIVATGVWLFPSRAAVQSSPSAREIMDRVSVTRKLAGSEAVVQMGIISSDGQSRDREIAMATKLYDDGKTEKRIYKFLSPAEIKGTGVLVFDYETDSDDVWVYLPALRKTRRIVSSQRSQSFMGSEFTYADMNVPALDDYGYKLLREEAYGGEPCWVIDVLPKTPEVAQGEGYSKKTFWISKDKFALRRGLYYDAKGQLWKELKADDLQLLDPKQKRYRPLRMEMTNKQNGRRSVFTSKKVTFAPAASDDYFTPRYLERP
jgi:outer membrane lipoprotein-sorting protein